MYYQKESKDLDLPWSPCQRAPPGWFDSLENQRLYLVLPPPLSHFILLNPILFNYMIFYFVSAGLAWKEASLFLARRLVLCPCPTFSTLIVYFLYFILHLYIFKVQSDCERLHEQPRAAVARALRLVAQQGFAARLHRHGLPPVAF